MSAQRRLTDEGLAGYLRELGLAGPDEDVAVEPAGDGNINWVRRARLADGRSWIVKQARPALERFPEYRASTERIVFEARYTELARGITGGICPEIVHFDERERVLVLVDAGDAERLDERLARGWDARGTASALGTFLGMVHAATADPALPARFANEEMRRLHGDHIFRLPFERDGFPLSDTVAERTRCLRTDEFRSLAADAYLRYLEPRGALVHADVQAGNVLLPPGGPLLLDAEIAHVGDPAFDVGTLVAHLALPAIAAGDARRAGPSLHAAWSAYVEALGEEPDFAAAARYAGLEMLRRTVGAARVAAVAQDAAALRVIDAGERWVREPPAHPASLV